MKIEKKKYFKGRNSVLNEVVSRHFPEGLEKNKEHFNQENQLTGRDPNRTPTALPLYRRVRCLNNIAPNGMIFKQFEYFIRSVTIYILGCRSLTTWSYVPKAH
jgi:hypothetical protein